MNVENGTERLMKFWPIFVILGGGIAGYLKLKWTVDELAASQRAYKTIIEDRRQKARDEMEDIRVRLSILEDRQRRPGCMR